ncbi:hypothetical protein ACXPWS_30715 [Mycobacterium sp. BMJ-28]
MTALNRIVTFRMTVAEWVGTALLLAAPYVAIGVLWSMWHLDQLSALTFVRSTVTWPILLFGNGCAS